LRLVVGRGFLDTYPAQAFPPHLKSLVSDYATNQELSTQMGRQLLAVETCPQFLDNREIIRLARDCVIDLASCAPSRNRPH